MVRVHIYDESRLIDTTPKGFLRLYRQGDGTWLVLIRGLATKNVTPYLFDLESEAREKFNALKSRYP